MTSESRVESAWVEIMGQFLYRLDRSTRKIKRTLEKNEIKNDKKMCSIVFNKTCLNNNLMP